MPDKSDHTESHLSEPSPEPDILSHAMPSRLKFYGLAALCIAGAVVVLGLGSRFYAGLTAAQWTEDQAIPSVQTITLKASRAGGDLNLPGDVQPFTNAPIFAQVSGTVQKWYVDIGGKVKTGDPLAQIDREGCRQRQGRVHRAVILGNRHIGGLGVDVRYLLAVESPDLIEHLGFQTRAFQGRLSDEKL